MDVTTINVGTTYVGLKGQYVVESAEHGRSWVSVSLKPVDGTQGFNTTVHAYSVDEWRWQA